MSGAVITARAALHDQAATRQNASLAMAKSIFSYSLPIVLANVLYFSIPLANRSIVAALYGFSETGQFSLAYDIGSKAVLAIGSTLDVVLFQIAVALHDEHGPGKARSQMARNMSIVFAAVLPACTGIWLTLPSIQDVIVPMAYRGPFGELLTLMMAGLFSGALIQFGITPLFMIAKRTTPLIAGALIACVVDPLLILVLPRHADASSFAIAQTGAYMVALVALIIMASFSKPQWPRLRDLALTALATAAMAAALLPLREHHPGFLTLVAQVAAGTFIYGLFVYVFDIANLREIAIARLRPIIARLQASS
jgi:O-antigen/teichoic acid export membrane protein